MKRAQVYNPTNSDFLVQALSARKLLEEKVRVNLYLPKVVVELMDSMSENRGELLTELVLAEVKVKQGSPYAMLTSRTSDEDMAKLKFSWERTVDELAQ